MSMDVPGRVDVRELNDWVLICFNFESLHSEHAYVTDMSKVSATHKEYCVSFRKQVVFF
jgi:hypothetical protein